jgi:hypothetical protein
MLNIYSWIWLVESTYGIPSIVKYSLSVFALGTIIYYKLLNPSKPSPGLLFYPFVIIFVIWSLIILVSAATRFNNLFYLQRVFAQDLFFLPYLIPIIILFTKFDLEFFNDYFYYCFILIIPAILIQLFVILTGISIDKWSEQVNGIGIFDLGSGFLLLTAHLAKKRYIFNSALIYAVLMIFLFAQYGRRGMVTEYMLLIFFMIIFRLRSSFLNFNDRIKMYFAGLIMIILILIFGYLITSSFVFQRGFTKEAFEESRGVVVSNFFVDFNSTSDWIFGRGLLGTVFRAIYLENQNADFIENGFLMLLLKGGLLYLIPFMLILLRASFLGFFSSNNDYAKAMASLLLIHVIGMFSFNVPVYSTKYILIWIFATACFTPKIRDFSNEEIYQTLNSRLERTKVHVL